MEFYQYVLRDLIMDLAVLLACFKISKVFFSADFKACKNITRNIKQRFFYFNLKLGVTLPLALIVFCSLANELFLLS